MELKKNLHAILATEKSFCSIIIGRRHWKNPRENTDDKFQIFHFENIVDGFVERDLLVDQRSVKINIFPSVAGVFEVVNFERLEKFRSEVFDNEPLLRFSLF